MKIGMNKISLILTVLVSIFSLLGCGSAIQEEAATETPTVVNTDIAAHAEGWTEETHGNDADPDYETVFPQDEVNRIDITIDPENWEIMLADMTEMMGEFGQGDGMGAANDRRNPPPEGFVPGQGAEPENLPDRPGRPAGGQVPPDGNFNQGGRDPGDNMNLTDENPVWVTATITFEGDT